MRRTLLMLMTLTLPILAKDMKIGFVESTRVFAQYQATAVANVEFNEFVSSYRDSAAVSRNKIETAKSELESQKLVLSEDARLRKLDEIARMTSAYEKFLQDAFGEAGLVERKNDELMAPLLKKINEAVAKIAEGEGFSVVFDLSEGVFYASSDLDITNLVIDELNLEYGPAGTPGSELKKAIAVFPFREKNVEATNAGLYQICQNELYNAVTSLTQTFKIISKSEVNSEVVKRGFGRNVDDDQALVIAKFLMCDYLVIGDVSKFGTRIEYTMYLIDVNADKEIGKKSNTVTEEIKLFETLKNDLLGLIDKIE